MGTGLVVFMALWATYVLGICPAERRINTLNRVIPEKQQVLKQIDAKSGQYRSLKAQLNQYKHKAGHREKDFELLRYVEAAVREMKMDNSVTSMKQDIMEFNGGYSQITGEVKLESVSLQQLVGLLLKVKNSPYGLKTSSLYVRKNTKNPEYLDVLIQISTLNSSQDK